MNIQSMMKQVQQIQKEMLKEQEEIAKTIYTEKNSLVQVEANGKKEILKIKINTEAVETDDIEMIEDMLLVAINNVFEKIDKETESRLGKYTKGMPGLF